MSADHSSSRRSGPQARVLVTAAGLFLRQGYVVTSVADIARDAGVALQTVYRGFGSKVGLLSAVQDRAVVGDGEPVSQLDRQWACELTWQPPREALGVLVGELVSSAVRAGPIFEVIHSASADPAVRDLLEETHRRRVRTCQELARRVLGEASGRSERFGDLIYLVLGMETFGLLIVRRSWNEQQWRDWAYHTLDRELGQQVPLTMPDQPHPDQPHRAGG